MLIQIAQALLDKVNAASEAQASEEAAPEATEPIEPAAPESTPESTEAVLVTAVDEALAAKIAEILVPATEEVNAPEVVSE